MTQNLRSKCLSPILKHVMNIFVKFLMALLIGFRGKSTHINTKSA
jgi:hypothetical protein